MESLPLGTQQDRHDTNTPNSLGTPRSKFSRLVKIIGIIGLGTGLIFGGKYLWKQDKNQKDTEISKTEQISEQAPKNHPTPSLMDSILCTKPPTEEPTTKEKILTPKEINKIFEPTPKPITTQKTLSTTPPANKKEYQPLEIRGYNSKSITKVIPRDWNFDINQATTKIYPGREDNFLVEIVLNLNSSANLRKRIDEKQTKNLTSVMILKNNNATYLQWIGEMSQEEKERGEQYIQEKIKQINPETYGPLFTNLHEYEGKAFRLRKGIMEYQEKNENFPDDLSQIFSYIDPKNYILSDTGTPFPKTAEDVQKGNCDFYYFKPDRTVKQNPKNPLIIKIPRRKDRCLDKIWVITWDLDLIKISLPERDRILQKYNLK